jgi:hypothetical protein
MIRSLQVLEGALGRLIACHPTGRPILFHRRMTLMRMTGVRRPTTVIPAVHLDAVHHLMTPDSEGLRPMAARCRTARGLKAAGSTDAAGAGRRETGRDPLSLNSEVEQDAVVD